MDGFTGPIEAKVQVRQKVLLGDLCKIRFHNTYRGDVHAWFKITKVEPGVVSDLFYGEKIASGDNAIPQELRFKHEHIIGIISSNEDLGI